MAFIIELVLIVFVLILISRFIAFLINKRKD